MAGKTKKHMPKRYRKTKKTAGCAKTMSLPELRTGLQYIEAYAGKVLAKTDDMRQAAADNRLRRPKKPRAPKLYAYLGGGVDHQPDQVSSSVIRTRDREFVAAAVAATRLAMATWPSGSVAATLYEDQVDGEAEHAANLGH